MLRNKYITTAGGTQYRVCFHGERCVGVWRRSKLRKGAEWAVNMDLPSVKKTIQIAHDVLRAEQTPSVRQRDRFSAYLNAQGVVRRGGTCHWLARNCGNWNAIVLCSDGSVRAFDLSADRETRQGQLTRGTRQMRLRMASGGVHVDAVFAIRWKKEPEHV